MHLCLSSYALQLEIRTLIGTLGRDESFSIVFSVQRALCDFILLFFLNSPSQKIRQAN